jgi:hypothetical protein
VLTEPFLTGLSNLRSSATFHVPAAALHKLMRCSSTIVVPGSGQVAARILGNFGNDNGVLLTDGSGSQIAFVSQESNGMSPPTKHVSTASSMQITLITNYAVVRGGFTITLALDCPDNYVPYNDVCVRVGNLCRNDTSLCQASTCLARCCVPDVDAQWCAKMPRMAP